MRHPYHHHCFNQTRPVRFRLTMCNVHHGNRGTYLVGLLLVLISLLVRSGLGLVWGALLVVQGLPSLTEDFADLT